MLEFEFNGQSSREYGIILASIDESDELESRTLILGQKNKYRPRENHFGTTYDKNYSFQITLIKNPCRATPLPDVVDGTLIYPELYTPTLNQEGTLLFPYTYEANVVNNVLSSGYTGYFTSNEVRYLNAWLTSPQFPKTFKLINSEYYMEDIEFFVTINASNAEHIDKPYKLTYTVTCDSPYAYTSLITKRVTASSEFDSKFSIYTSSDCWDDYVYPILKFTPVTVVDQDNEGGETKPKDIKITNHTDNERELTLSISEVVFMDCDKLRLYNEKNETVTFDELGVDVDDIVKFYWLRLCHGNNDFTITGDVIVDISYREARKVGAFA